MQTEEKLTEFELEPRAEVPRRRLVAALAGAAAVLVVAAGLWAITRSSEPDVADQSPLEVTNLYNQAVATGDWAALRALYADAAELQIVSPSETLSKERLIDRVPQTPDDWDGDGLVTGFDGLIHEGAFHYAGGTTTFLSCTQVDAVTAVCEEVWEGFAFKRPNHIPTTYTLTIVDGVITTHVIEVVRRPADPILSTAVDQYRKWVSDNRPELEAELFDRRDLPSGIDARWPDWTTPDTAETHRELVTEWQAQQ